MISNLTVGHRYKVKIRARVSGNHSNYKYFEIEEGSETHDFYLSDESLNRTSVEVGGKITAYVIQAMF